MTTIDIKQKASELASKSPQDILKFALDNYENLAISFSGAEDVVLVDMAYKISKNIKVFSLDTGRLHSETYEFINRVREHYQLDIDIMFPNHESVQQLVQQKGLFSFYQDGHKECCGIRKVEPLRRKLNTLGAWITGQRKDQSVSTRVDIDVIEVDAGFSTATNQLIKFNPLANWTSKQVWDYIQLFDVPFNSLHSKGFVSIGCEPCTRSVLPGQHEREGRWWWEDSGNKECGLHAGNVKK